MLANLINLLIYNGFALFCVWVPTKKGASKKAPLCNLVTDYRTFIEDFQRLVQFVDYLDAREEYLPPIH